MKVRGFRSAQRFLERAGPWLQAREAENNLILGLALANAERDPGSGEDAPWFAVVESGDEIVGAAFRTPPHLLGLTAMPAEALPILKRAVEKRFAKLPGVVGPPAMVRGMAALWAVDHEVRLRNGPRMEIMRLGAIPARELRSRGRLRLAAPAEFPLFIEWLTGFEVDTGIFSEGADETVARLMEEEALFAWEVDGEPVAMVATSGSTPRTLRVSYVYTPPEYRGRGFASDSTAVLSRRILESGREFCVLYVDVNDPVARHIYRSLGYETVAESQVLIFDDPVTT